MRRLISSTVPSRCPSLSLSRPPKTALSTLFNRGEIPVIVQVGVDGRVFIDERETDSVAFAHGQARPGLFILAGTYTNSTDRYPAAYARVVGLHSQLSEQKSTHRTYVGNMNELVHRHRLQ